MHMLDLIIDILYASTSSTCTCITPSEAYAIISAWPLESLWHLLFLFLAKDRVQPFCLGSSSPSHFAVTSQIAHTSINARADDLCSAKQIND